MRFTPQLKAETTSQIVERGYSAPKTTARLGVSPHGFRKWVKAVAPGRFESRPVKWSKPKETLNKTSYFW
ncbi:transposase [Metapseudomonas boanensis]|uniref:Transposase n=1 Tax=Metapseudomonas boanensis TaxID=2822138 RepID=A0ABS5XPJ6_9GAMM|nr:transposase [Pseudomonas boanensis]